MDLMLFIQLSNEFSRKALFWVDAITNKFLTQSKGITLFGLQRLFDRYVAQWVSFRYSKLGIYFEFHQLCFKISCAMSYATSALT